MPFGAILGIGASLIGGAINAGASQSAANTQAQAADQASATQQQEFNQIQQSLAPFLTGGTSANNTLLSLLGLHTDPLDQSPTTPNTSFLGANAQQGYGPPPSFQTVPFQAPGFQTTPFTAPTYNLPQFTQQKFQQSPGYNYALQQTQNATRNAATPGQGALSGATLKALQSNASGLANQDWYNALNNYTTNYNNQFNATNQGALENFNAGTTNANNLFNALNQGATETFNAGTQNANSLFNSQNQNYWNSVNSASNNQNQLFNFLNQLAGRGASTGTAQGSLGTTTAAQIGQNQIGAGNALSAGTLGTGNAIGQTLGNVTNLFTNPVYSNMGGATNSGTNNSLLAQLLYGSGQNNVSGAAAVSNPGSFDSSQPFGY